MKKFILCGFIVLAVGVSGCASAYKFKPLDSETVSNFYEKVLLEQGPSNNLIEGEYLEVTTKEILPNNTNTKFVCSNYETTFVKEVLELTIISNTQGRIVADSKYARCRGIDAGVVKGLQTDTSIYLEQGGNRIVHYDIDKKTNALIKRDSLRMLKGRLTSYDKIPNNGGVSDGKRYRTTFLQPKTNWGKVRAFDEAATLSANNAIISKGGGFQWGKALALGAGAVAGGGLKLDTDTQAGVIAGIILDSQAGTSGTSNLDNAVQSSLETNARRAAANSVSEQDITQNSTSLEAEPTTKQSVGSSTKTPNAVSTPNASGNSRKCGIFHYSAAEEQAEKNRLGAILQSKLATIPSYDYETRNQAWRDFEGAMADWRKARHEACGIDTSRTSRVTRE